LAEAAVKAAAEADVGRPAIEPHLLR